MDTIFCTLFDSNYLDKGLTLYNSMVEAIGDFKLYIFAFDQRCYDTLVSENLSNAVIVSLKEFETPELLKVKKERNPAEYCWTCSSWTIRYVLEHYHEKICTYIDADMMFFSSPQPVFNEMKKRNCSIIIVPHRFKNGKMEKKAHDEVGSYCVEFNTFVNDENGNEALKWWSDSCLDWCFYAIPGTTEWYGDQKYLNEFPKRFKGVMVCDHFGVGMAPWNAKLARWSQGINDGGRYIPCVRYVKDNIVYPVVLYHFESVQFLTKNIINAPSMIKSKKLHSEIYDKYVHALISNRLYIEQKYNFTLSRKKRVVSSNLLMKIYQKFIKPFLRVKSFKDLYRVRNK